MTLEQTLNIIAIYGTLLGAFYTVKGFLSLSPIEILKSIVDGASIVHSHSLRDITGGVQQRVESRIGIIIVTLSAVIQIIVLCLGSVVKSISIDSKFLGFVAIVVFLLTLFSHYYCRWATKRYVLEANKLYVVKHMDTETRNNGTSFLNDDFIISCAEHYFGLKQGEAEARTDFIKRIYDYVGVTYPYKSNTAIESRRHKTFQKIFGLIAPTNTVAGLYYVLCLSIGLFFGALEVVNTKPVGFGQFILGLVLLGYYPVIFLYAKRKCSPILFISEERALRIQMALLMFLVVVNLTSWNVMMGVHFVVIALLNLFEITTDTLWGKVLVDGFGIHIILLAPVAIILLSMKYYKNNISEIYYLTQCKFFVAWVTAFSAFAIFGNVYWSSKSLETILKSQDIWGAGLSILVFGAMLEYYSIKKPEKSCNQDILENKENE